MNRTRRGAARVSITWIIVVMIAFFASLAMVFVFDGELEVEKKKVVTAIEAKQSADTKYDAEVDYGRQLSKLLGWYDKTLASPHTIVAEAEEGLTQFKDAFNNNEASVTDMQSMIKRAGEERNALIAEVRTLKAQVEGMKGEIAAGAASLATISSEKESEIQRLRGQISDDTQAAADTVDGLESQLADARATAQETLRQLTAKSGEVGTIKQQSRDRDAVYTTRLETMTRRLAWSREPERADGQILDVSEKLGLAYINLGKSNRLYGGMRFSIVDGRTGDNTVKAYCEVLNVMDGMSEVKIVDVRDPFDPPTAGDVIFNPLYDPTGLRNAVLLGRFTGTYNKAELRALLEGININAQARLDKTTDYLIVGAEMYTDADGEPLDDPLQPSDSPIYKEAQAMGVRIVPLKLVTDYFRKSN